MQEETAYKNVCEDCWSDGGEKEFFGAAEKYYVGQDWFDTVNVFL